MSTCSLLSCNPAAHRVCDQPPLSCEKCSFISRRGRLTQIQHPLCGQLSTASAGTGRALFTYMCVGVSVNTYVCSYLPQREREREYIRHSILLSLKSCKLYAAKSVRRRRKLLFGVRKRQNLETLDLLFSWFVQQQLCYQTMFLEYLIMTGREQNRKKNYEKVRRREVMQRDDKSKTRIWCVLDLLLLFFKSLFTAEECPHRRVA